jgi:GGDEF domain-containing protein
MHRFRFLLIAIIAWILLVLSLDRTILAQVELSAFTYVLGAAIVITLMLIPNLARLTTATLFMCVLAIYAPVSLFQHINAAVDAPLVTEISLEIFALAVTLWLVKQVSISVHRFEQTIENAAFHPHQTRVLSTHAGEQAITEELLRGRRYNRPIALLYIQVQALQKLENDPSKQWDMQKGFQLRYLRNRIAQMTQSLLMKSDILCWHNGNLVICLPENNAQNAQQLVRQLDELFNIVLNVPASIGMACFPDEALVYTDLIEVAKTSPWRENAAEKRSTGEMKQLKLSDQVLPS